MKVLLIEDQPTQRRVLARALQARSFEVLEAADGKAGLDSLRVATPDLVVLDLGLPDLDGLHVCRHLVELTSAPVIVLTADASESRIVDALTLGASDYVTKPYSMPVLMARIDVALRHAAARPDPSSQQHVVCGHLRMDLAAREAFVDDRPLVLTTRQFDLLTLLARNQGRLLTSAAMQRHLWGIDLADDRTASLRNLVSQLRRALGDGPRAPTIESQPGVGYRLVA